MIRESNQLFNQKYIKCLYLKNILIELLKNANIITKWRLNKKNYCNLYFKKIQEKWQFHSFIGRHIGSDKLEILF